MTHVDTCWYLYDNQKQVTATSNPPWGDPPTGRLGQAVFAPPAQIVIPIQPDIYYAEVKVPLGSSECFASEPMESATNHGLCVPDRLFPGPVAPLFILRRRPGGQGHSATNQRICESCPVKRALRYVELKTGFRDDGPATISWVSFSKTWKTVYYRDRTLHRLPYGSSGGGNHYDAETLEKYWVSGSQEGRE